MTAGEAPNSLKTAIKVPVDLYLTYLRSTMALWARVDDHFKRQKR